MTSRKGLLRWAAPGKLGIGLAAMLLHLDLLHAGEWHPHADIQAAAERSAQSLAGGGDARLQARASPLDARLRLPRCQRPLEARAGRGMPRSGRLTVEVRCDSGSAWRLHVPVNLTVTRPVLVATRAIGRDEILTPGDLELTELDTTQLPYGFLDAPQQAAGRQLRRPVTAGTVIHPGLLEAPLLIRRGQDVTLEARTGGITVRMAGRARSDGIDGQVIQVENLSSGRTVQAIVRSARVAEVLLQ
ncbi:MAG: flagellar basal body P-ring formation protein FlgA [Chromatiales bacterium]|nr:flagellar basal body P-ring formation protein FlgA [Chromatiales bacterium]